jgi:hypothetical protein
MLLLAAIAAPVALAGEAVRPSDPASTACKPPAACGDVAGYAERSLAATTAKDRYALGLWCKEKGLQPEARAQFRAAIKLDPELAAAREELGERLVAGRWVPAEESLRAKGLVPFEGEWLLPEEKATRTAPKEERERLAAEEQRARKLLETMAAGDERAARMAKEALKSVPDAALVGPLAFGLRAANVDVRTFAASEIGRIGDRRGMRALVFRALVDPSTEVRAACVAAARKFNDPELLAPFAEAFLNSPSASTRAAAAEAIGGVGDVRGVQLLVQAIEGHGGGPRSHIYFATQQSFIQDFDVEVAQTAFIADPMVGVLQEGAVLDVKVVSNEWYSTRVERQAIYGSLRGLTGQTLPDEVAAWSKWHREQASAKK